jgi:DNA-binding SARP family transcriptional activator/tetratricopeptide (TPR) repeat protein
LRRRPESTIVLDEVTAPLEIQVLGRFSVRRAGKEIPPAAFGGRLAQRLVRVLVTRRGEFVTRDVLTEALWKGRPPADPETNLSVQVNRARRALGDPSPIVTGPGGYRLTATQACTVDAEYVLASVHTGATRLAAGQAGPGLAAFRAALDAWGGEPLAEDLYEDWARDYRVRLQRAYLEALEGASSAALDCGDPAEAVGLAELAVLREPLREASNLLLVQSLAICGDSAGALSAFSRFRHQLGEELGVDPSADALALELQVLRGEIGPDPARRAVSTLPRALPFEALPFVGRAEELSTALDALGGNEPGIILISGSAGSGKSRLLAEISRRWAGPVLAARAFHAEAAEPWSLGRTLLREVLAVDTSAASAVPARALRALADVVPELEELDSPVPASMDAESRRALAMEAAVLLVHAIASSGAVMLVDDLQWADATSVSMLALIAGRVPQVGMVVAYRPEDVPLVPLASELLEARGTGRGSAISLGQLSERAIEQLVVDDSLAGVIAEESDRTPFAVTEVIRSLARDGAIEPASGGRWRMRSPGARELARETARAGRRRAVQMRVETQPTGRREVLAVLTLLGREAPARLVASAISAPQNAILVRLEALARVGLVRLGDRGWTLDHDIIAEVLRDGLGAAERGRLHEGIAAALLEHDADPAEVAHHLQGAGDVQAAAELFGRAADRSLSRFAHDEAEALADRGLGLDPTPEVRFRLLMARAEARARRGNPMSAREDLQRAMADRVGPERSHILTRIASLTAGAEDYARANELFALALAEAGRDPQARARALAVGARIAINLDQLTRGEALADEARVLFEQVGDGEGVADVLDTQAVATAHGGRIREAVALFKRVANLFEDSGNLLHAGMPWSDRGYGLVLMNRPGQGLECIEKALHLERSLGQTAAEAYCLWHRSEALAWLGRSEEASESASRALAIARKLRHQEWIAAAWKGLGWAALAGGDLDRAEAAYKECLQAAENLPIFRSWAAAGLATVLIGQGDLGQAEECVRLALGVGTHATHYEARLAQVQLAMARGDGNARSLAAEALERTEEGGHLVSAVHIRKLLTSLVDEQSEVVIDRESAEIAQAAR